MYFLMFKIQYRKINVATLNNQIYFYFRQILCLLLTSAGQQWCKKSPLCGIVGYFKISSFTVRTLT